MENNQLVTLIVADHDNQSVSVDTLHTISAAISIGSKSDMDGEVLVLVAGHQCSDVVSAVGQIDGVSQVLVADAAEYQYPLAENLSELIVSLCQVHRCSHVLAPANTFGKNLMPCVAALLDVGLLSDVTAIESADTVVRPIYAGNALARVKSLDAIKLMTVRSSAFDAASSSAPSATITAIDTVIESTLSQFVEAQKVVSERPELSAARVVVSGGRGLGNKESFSLVEQLADKLGGAIGASRAAVDAGFVSNDLQVGQTGKIVAPELYIAVGISGAIQHLAGMKDSKVIVAINNDPEAPIFQIADYGLVGDLFEIMPELIEKC